MSDSSKHNIDRNIINNAYYMISLFDESKNKFSDFDDGGDEERRKLINNLSSVSNLKLQKMMYFVEAYFMSKCPSEDEMFDSPWNAWDYGPVNKDLYNKFKKFGGLNISLSSSETDIAFNLNENNKKYIKKTYDVLGGLSAFDLVTLTHLDGSPWSEVKKTTDYNFQELNDSIINKKKTKEWFIRELNRFFETEETNNE